MQTVRPAADHLKNLEPYDPKYLPARVYLNANENPYGMPEKARTEFVRMIESEPLHRYPDPLAKRLRSAVSTKLGLAPECIVLGNGGDELLFNLCLAYGGKGRSMLIAPPTFASYYSNALLTHTELVEVPRAGSVSLEGMLDLSIDEEAILERISSGTIDIVMLTSPNNPSGDCLSLAFIKELLAASDAVVLIDHAYIEFSAPGFNATSLLAGNANLAILRTFSKAYGLAGMRIGYIAANTGITSELCKVRQPYSVDSLAALAALSALAEEDEVQRSVERIVSERLRLASLVGSLGHGIPVAPSEANYLLIKVPNAHAVWKELHETYGILVRDLSAQEGLTDCLRVSIGTPAENDEFIKALREIAIEN